MNATARLRAALEWYIDADANRWAEETLARLLAELRADSPQGRDRKVRVTGVGAGKRDLRAGRVVSDATKANTPEAWARRKAAKAAADGTQDGVGMRMSPSLGNAGLSRSDDVRLRNAAGECAASSRSGATGFACQVARLAVAPRRRSASRT